MPALNNKIYIEVVKGNLALLYFSTYFSIAITVASNFS